MFSHIQIGARDLPKMVAFMTQFSAAWGWNVSRVNTTRGRRGGLAAPRQALAAGFRPVAFQRPARHLGQWHASKLRR